MKKHLHIQIKVFIFVAEMMEKKSPYCKCLYYSANALARIITKIAEEEFAVTGLAPSYAFVVMTVNKNPGLQAGEISEIMMLTPSTVTRLLEKLETQDLIKRHTEGRTTLVYPTKHSVELDEQIKAAWFKIYQRCEAKLGETLTKQLTADIFNAAIKLEAK